MYQYCPGHYISPHIERTHLLSAIHPHNRRGAKYFLKRFVWPPPPACRCGCLTTTGLLEFLAPSEYGDPTPLNKSSMPKPGDTCLSLHSHRQLQSVSATHEHLFLFKRKTHAYNEHPSSEKQHRPSMTSPNKAYATQSLCMQIHETSSRSRMCKP